MRALAGAGRERENPRSERSEPAALKVQLCGVGGGRGISSPAWKKESVLDITGRVPPHSNSVK